jgi:uncharacterized RDD family membrane protein YckC
VTTTGMAAGVPAGFACADAPNRLIAYLLDAIVVSGAAFLAAAAVSALAGPAVRFAATGEVRVNGAVLALDALVATAVNAGYFIASWTTLAGSPAQRLLRLTVVGVDDGRPLTVSRAATRWLGLGAPFVVATALGLAVPPLAGVLLLAALAWYAVLLAGVTGDPPKQGLHDRLAGTVVLKATPAASLPRREEAGVR